MDKNIHLSKEYDPVYESWELRQRQSCKTLVTYLLGPSIYKTWPRKSSSACLFILHIHNKIRKFLSLDSLWKCLIGSPPYSNLVCDPCLNPLILSSITSNFNTCMSLHLLYSSTFTDCCSLLCLPASSSTEELQTTVKGFGQHPYAFTLKGEAQKYADSCQLSPAIRRKMNIMTYGLLCSVKLDNGSNVRSPLHPFTAWNL